MCLTPVSVPAVQLVFKDAAKPRVAGCTGDTGFPFHRACDTLPATGFIFSPPTHPH